LHNKIANAFIKKFTKKVSKLVVGSPYNENTDIGPVIDLKAAMYIEKVIKLAIQDGARLLLGGKRKDNFIYPTVLDMVNPKSQIVKKETFGPVAPIIRINNLDEAISIANSTVYGLSDAICTNNISNALRVAKKIKTGMLVINEAPGFRIESIPFGGVKKSGLGKEGIKYAVREMSDMKTILI
jgi:lactaldehyde dehydrogenase